MTGAKSKLLDETNEVYTRIMAGKAEFIKVKKNCINGYIYAYRAGSREKIR